MERVTGRAGRTGDAEVIFALEEAAETHAEGERRGGGRGAENRSGGVEELQRDIVALRLLHKRDLVCCGGIGAQREVEHIEVRSVMQRQTADLTVILNVRNIIGSLDSVVSAEVVDIGRVANNLNDRIRARDRIRLVKRHAKAARIGGAG